MRKVTRRQFVKGLGAAAAGTWVSGLTAWAGRGDSARRRPNVVLVITDDQGYGDLGCHGNKIIRTPNLDRLYEQSVRLTNFHVGPTCSPTRAALMTGRYCNRTGVWHTIMGRSILRGDEVTMANAFSAGGYRTGICGKWHLGDNYPARPQDKGFQEVLVHGGGGVGQTPDYWGNDYFDDTYFHNGRTVKFRGYCTDIWFDHAIQFVRDNQTRPFFMYLTTNTPHGPFNVSDEYSGLYADNPDVPNAAFYGMITNIDENMGRLMATLDELGLADDTILIFMTDNGTAAGFRNDKGFNAQMRGTKGSEYDGGHRVPCFIRWPGAGLAGGRDVNRLTAHIDLLPTLIDLCGLPKPPGVELDGTSIKPLLKGDESGWPDRVLVTDSQRIERPEKWRKSAVMTDRWRLLNGRELYDIQTDPGQKNDIAAAHPGVVGRLRDAYERWWSSVSARFDEYCRIIVGSEHENPSTLTCHDWHEGAPPWNQRQIAGASKNNGFWAIEVARTGEYEISLRRWPIELNQPINAAVEGSKRINAVQARCKVGDFDESLPVGEGASAVTFRAQLAAGETKLQTWFVDADGSSRGAFYAYVKRL